MATPPSPFPTANFLPDNPGPLFSPTLKNTSLSRSQQGPRGSVTTGNRLLPPAAARRGFRRNSALPARLPLDSKARI
jgi:hypothetical protein